MYFPSYSSLFLCACRMSEETKAGPSRQVLKIPPLARAEISAVADVRTLQDVRSDIAKENAQLKQALQVYQATLLAYNCALTSSDNDPNNKILSEELADAKGAKDAYKTLVDSYRERLSSLRAELDGLHVTANASSTQSSKLCSRVFTCPVSGLFCIVCLECLVEDCMISEDFYLLT